MREPAGDNGCSPPKSKHGYSVDEIRGGVYASSHSSAENTKPSGSHRVAVDARQQKLYNTNGGFAMLRFGLPESAAFARIAMPIGKNLGAR